MIKIDWSYNNQKEPEINMLQEFLKDYKIERVLEIGTNRGDTATLWAKIVEPNNGKVYCIDKNFKKQVYNKIPQRKFIIKIQGNSHDPEIKKKVFNEVNDVDLLFIDGDHSYEGVKDDFETYSKLVKPGGFIVFHDIVDSEFHRKYGVYVSQLWNEIKNNYEYKEFIYDKEYGKWPRECMGIGVLKIL